MLTGGELFGQIDSKYYYADKLDCIFNVLGTPLIENPFTEVEACYASHIQARSKFLKLKKEIEDPLPTSAFSLLRAMLNIIPDKRITVEDALNH